MEEKVRKPNRVKETYDLAEKVRGYGGGPSLACTKVGRYSNSIRRLTELLKMKKGEDLVIHIIGVGEEGAPQVSEAIKTLSQTGKKIEVHLIDFNKNLLDEATKKAREEFQGLDILSHEIDLAAPAEMPLKRAHAVICTNVIPYIQSYELKASAFHNLASFVKNNGYLLVEKEDLMHADVKSADRLGNFGLTKMEEIEETKMERDSSVPDYGAILQKTHESKAFDELMNDIIGSRYPRKANDEQA